MKHIARKRFGQHFLVDRAVIEAIVCAIDPQPGQDMVEIGPGLGAMTEPLAQRLGHLSVVEIDRDLAAKLRCRAELEVVETDVLRFDFSAWARRPRPSPIHPPSAATPTLRVVGNLPYNISTPTLFHLLKHVDVVQDQHFMLQKEVVNRMVAAPACADYGRLSVMLQWRYAMGCVMAVGPQSFEPPPRVDSAIVRMVPLARPPGIDLALYGALVQTAFGQRRKILRNTLGPWLQERQFSGHFDLQRRAEEVPVSEYVALALALR